MKTYSLWDKKHGSLSSEILSCNTNPLGMYVLSSWNLSASPLWDVDGHMVGCVSILFIALPSTWEEQLKGRKLSFGSHFQRFGPTPLGSLFLGPQQSRASWQGSCGLSRQLTSCQADNGKGGCFASGLSPFSTFFFFNPGSYLWNCPTHIQGVFLPCG